MTAARPFLVLGLLLAGWIAGCSREPATTPTSTNAPPSSTPAFKEPLPGDGDRPGPSHGRSELPRAGEVSGYTGSSACQTCHEDQHASWHRSYHRTMTQLPVPGAVQADFHNVILTNDGSRFTLRQQGNEFRIRMEKLVSAGDGELPPAPVEVGLGLITGSHHMQVFWVGSGQGNTQLGFPFTWLIPEKRWVPRNTTFIRPPDTVHRSEVWNVVCSRCHATGPEPRPNSVERTLDTRVAELGISCEACHGPGEKHVRARQAARHEPRPDAATLAREIVQPGKLPAVRSGQVCGFCHSMKWIPNSERWMEHGFTFRPGDDLETTTPIIRAADTNRPPALAAYLAQNPELLSSFFWSDGMVRVSGREYNGMIESPCYRGHQMSCVSCHSLHESDPAGQMARNRTDHRACTQCHEAYRDPAKAAAHSHHPAGSSGNDCFNCHMPHTTYGVLKGIRSHQISSPRVADQLATGRPNACNLCHLDQTLAWTADHLAAWYRQPRPERLPAPASAVAEAVRLGLSGDAGQRALIAWHLGWKPAISASGSEWMPPLLGQLLDDPYAAIRCVAERSARAGAAALPAGYDYVIDPRERPPVREAVWSSWGSNTATPPAAAVAARTLAQPGALSDIRGRFEALLRERDHRPMRLRE